MAFSHSSRADQHNRYKDASCTILATFLTFQIAKMQSWEDDSGCNSLDLKALCVASFTSAAGEYAAILQVRTWRTERLNLDLMGHGLLIHSMLPPRTKTLEEGV